MCLKIAFTSGRLPLRRGILSKQQASYLEHHHGCQPCNCQLEHHHADCPSPGTGFLFKYADLSYAKKAYSIFVDDLKHSFTTRACIFATLHRPATELLMDMLEESSAMPAPELMLLIP